MTITMTMMRSSDRFVQIMTLLNALGGNQLFHINQQVISNWFSAENAMRIYDVYVSLDKDGNGMLNQVLEIFCI